MTLEMQDPAALDKRRARFAEAAFIRAIGMQLQAIGPGWTETRLPVRPDHAQQDGFVHAGVQATMADHTAGMAAGPASAKVRATDPQG